MDDSWVLLGLLAVALLMAVPVLLLVALFGLSALKRRVGALESELAMLKAVASVRGAAADVGAHATRPANAPLHPAPASASASASTSTPATAAASARPPAPSVSAPPPLQPVTAPRPTPPPMTAVPSGPGPIERGIDWVKQWFTSGNVPVKVGMLVLLAGVASLLKYGSDQGWFSAPIELRLAGVAAVALAGLVFGWRQRQRKPLFALALQGGAIGALLLTVFAAAKLYPLLPAAAAFAISVVLIGGLCVLAVLQNSRTLAVLGILAGFLAPIWLSTGSGNHVALFAYYALLNAGVFVIAWMRPWRVLNLLGFAFTFGIGTVWGVSKYVPEHYASTQPFLVLFFAFYLLIPILYARRQPAQRRDLVDGSLVFGTPLVAFSLQAGLMDGQGLPLALCALGLALAYAGLARALISRPRYAALGTCYAILAVGFATLSVPLALSARATASVFALEGAALVWLGLRQHRRLPEVAGVGLQLAAAFGFLVGADYWRSDTTAFANASFMSAILLALAGVASAWSWQRAQRPMAAHWAYLWGLAWWLVAFGLEIHRFVVPSAGADAWLVVASVTGVLAAYGWRVLPLRALAWTAVGALASAFVLVFAQVDAHGQPFAGWGACAWAVFVIAGVLNLCALRNAPAAIAAAAQFVWWLAVPFVLSQSAYWVAERSGIAEGWQYGATALPWLAVLAISLWRWPWMRQPVGDAFDALRQPLQVVLLVIVGLGWLVGMLMHGNPAPLAWLPVLNPLELSQLLALVMLAVWLWSERATADAQRTRVALIAVAGFAWLTVATLRAVHHWGGVAWSERLWSSLQAQTSLTVVWSLLGVVAWIWGSRRGQRTLWRVGAVLMAVVLAKLVLVDRQHLGNLLGIASFLAYGLLCTAVGYFAPAPPKDTAHPGETA